MVPRSRGFAVFDNAFHVLWQMCAVVGAFTIPWVPRSATALRPLLVPMVAGLMVGLVTMPVVLRVLRPALARRFPWGFET